MSHARSDLIARLASLRVAFNENVLRSSPADTDEKKSASRMLRNGLAIISFCCLEDFVKKRAVETASVFSANAFPFVKLPEGMKIALTIGSANGGLVSQKREARKLDKVRIIQDVAAAISSTTGANYIVSEYAFGMDRSNINSDYVREIASCFGVADFWNQVDRVASQVGYGGATDYKQSYDNAMKTRHLAAHQPAFDAELSDLFDWVDQAIAIAIAFDMLLSQSSNELILGIPNLDSRAVDTRLQIRKIVYRKKSKTYAELSPINVNRAFRVSSNYDLLHQEATQRAILKREMLVVYNSKTQPASWFCG